MKSWMMKMTLAAVVGLLALPLSAATVTLVPYEPEPNGDYLNSVYEVEPQLLVVEPTDVFKVDLQLYTGDEPGLTYSGLPVAITFDSSLVRYDGFEINGPPIMQILLQDLTSGDTGKVVLGFLGAPGVPFEGVIGTFMFTALAVTGEDPTTIGVGCNNAPQNCFFNDEPSNTSFAPDFIPAEVSIVPIPAAVWMMLSGLGVLGGIARRRDQAAVS